MNPKFKYYIDKYKKKLGLDDYYIDVTIANENHFIADRNSKVEKTKTDYMVEVMSHGDSAKHFTIIINKSALKKELKDTILHEMIHILLWDYTDVLTGALAFTDLDSKAKDRLYVNLDNIEHLIIEKIIGELK